MLHVNGNEKKPIFITDYEENVYPPQKFPLTNKEVKYQESQHELG